MISAWSPWLLQVFSLTAKPSLEAHLQRDHGPYFSIAQEAGELL